MNGNRAMPSDWRNRGLFQVYVQRRNRPTVTDPAIHHGYFIGAGGVLTTARMIDTNRTTDARFGLPIVG